MSVTAPTILRHRPLRTALVAVLGAVLFVAVSASPAMADGAPAAPAAPPSPLTGSSSAPTTDASGLWTATPDVSAGAAGAGSYSSLAAAMVSYWAKQSNSTLSAFAQNNSGQLATALGSTSASGTLTQAAQHGALTTASVNAALTQSGATLDISGLTSMSGLLTQLQAKSQTLDGQVTTSGANWATQLGGLHSPALDTSTPTPDALVAGLLYDQGLSNLVATHPTLFAQASASGLGTAAGEQAWANSLASASAATAPKMSSLPNPCMAGMMQSMASGSVAANAGLGGMSCGACQVAGTYLHSQFLNIFNPGANSVLPSTTPGTTNSSSWSTMQGWLQQTATAQNPSLSSQLNSSFGGAGMASSCQGSSAATSGALSATLPGVFGNLGT